MKNRAKWNNTSGFTLLEMMVTVVVIVVLLALAMIPISKMQKDIRQTELDSRAEMIFSAVQNRMTRLQAAGQSDVYESGKTGVQKLRLNPQDADETEEQRTLVYVTSDGKAEDGSAAAWLYPETEAEAELWNGSWVVEYDAKGGSVYAVFYSREPITYKEEEFNDLRVRRNRVSAGAKIGYYGGDSVGAAETNNLTLTLEVINREKLQIVAACKMPVSVKDLEFYATVEDESGHIAKDIEIANHISGDSLVNVGRNYTATLTLDDLSVGKKLRFCEQNRFEDLVPGENLTVKIRVKAAKNPLIEDAIETVSVNSLFAEVEANGDDGRRAIIRYGRHLQNLELDASGLSKEQDADKIVTAAVQKQKIQFQGTEHDNWSELYPNRSFTPIENPKLKSYDSTDEENHPEICDLPIKTTADAGLFKTFGDKDFVGELKNICLVDARIIGGGNVGGLVGTLSGATTINGCQVYLKNVKKGLAKDKIFDEHTQIGGKVAGGLVGSTEGNPLTIQNSLAATVIQGVDSAGGLIGNISDGSSEVAVQNSYADCYLSSDGTNGKTGGLIGASGASAGVATKQINLRNCYAAGFLDGGVTAGFSTGSLSTVKFCYSACAPLTKAALSYGTASNNDTLGTDIEKVYYLSETHHHSTNIGVRMSYKDLSGQNAAARLSADFTKQNGDTYAYNLMNGLGLNQYSYPKLKDLPHYGDWQAAFEDSALVYYEWYGEKSYGFFGANVSTLSDKPVVGRMRRMARPMVVLPEPLSPTRPKVSPL